MIPIVDWADTVHAPATAPVRIASLVPSLTELLFALDLGQEVVARTGFCVHPAVRRARCARWRSGDSPDPSNRARHDKGLPLPAALA